MEIKILDAKADERRFRSKPNTDANLKSQRHGALWHAIPDGRPQPDEKPERFLEACRGNTKELRPQKDSE